MALMTPTQTARGTESLYPDAAIAFSHAVVHTGSDDHHFAAANGTKSPRGIVIHDLVSAQDIASGIKKNLAIFGIYTDSLQCVASGPIAADAQVVADPGNPGKVMQLPTDSGTYWVIGKSRFTVTTAGDPVSLAHNVPELVTVGESPVWVAPPANSGSAGIQGQRAYDAGNLYLCVAANTWVKFVGVTQFLAIFALTLLALFAGKAKAADGDLILLQRSGTGATVVQTIAGPIAPNQLLVTGSNNKTLSSTNTVPLAIGATLASGTFPSPLTNVIAAPGSLYVSIASGTANVFLKATGTDASGWLPLTTGSAQ